MLRAIARVRFHFTGLLAAGLLLLGAAATAQAAGGTAGPWSAHVGGGFTASPGAGLVALGVEYEPVPRLGVGPLLQMAFDNHVAIVAPTAGFRYRFDVLGVGDAKFPRLEPFVQGGLGFAYVDKDRRGRSDREDAEFMLNGGFGFDVRLDPHVSLGSTVLFNGMPADSAAGERFFFSWQLLTARVHF